MHQVSKFFLFCHETLYVSGIFCAHHQELSAIHVEILVSYTLYGRCLGQSCSNLTLLVSGHITRVKHTSCQVYS